MNKKIIVIVTVGVLLILGVLGIVFFTDNDDNSSNNENYVGDCINKGNICSDEEIAKGILLNISLSDTLQYEFYMISNDEDTMTLMMNSNLMEDYWHDEGINVRGPLGMLSSLSYVTSEWKNILPIEYYKYEDYGRKSYERVCSGDSIPDGYECNLNNPVIGYNYIEITNGRGYVKYNDNYNDINNKDGFNISNLSVRLITVDEILELYHNNHDKYPEWLTSNLNDNEGYWTMSSSADMATGYILGGYAIVKEENIIKSMLINKNLLGVRPVILVLKEEK